MNIKALSLHLNTHCTRVGLTQIHKPGNLEMKTLRQITGWPVTWATKKLFIVLPIYIYSSDSMH